MVNTNELLVLIYLNDFKDKYLFSETKEICNFSTTQMKNCLSKLKEKSLLTESEGILRVTKKGLSLLEEKGLENVSIQELYQIETVTLSFIDQPLSFEDVYIPKKFSL